MEMLILLMSSLNWRTCYAGDEHHPVYSLSDGECGHLHKDPTHGDKAWQSVWGYRRGCAGYEVGGQRGFGQLGGFLLSGQERGFWWSETMVVEFGLYS